tara:strand:- start:1005 stop:1199 length:195 start_codon:yes stop_codon:yes gene_type:complete
MSSKRRKMIMREGVRNFCPGLSAEPMMNGKCLSGYDFACYMEGWSKAENEYDSKIRHELEEKGE